MEIIVGIYRILFIPENISYIGQSRNIRNRWNHHMKTLCFDLDKAIKYGVNERLYNFWNKYGINNFKFEILEECNESELNKKEKYWLDFYGGFDSDKTFNMQDGGDYQILSKESRNKISNKLKNVPKTEECKTKISKSKLGIKTSNGFTGKHHNEETRKIISEKMRGELNPFYKKKHSEETLIKLCKPRQLTRIKNKEKFIKMYDIIINNPNMTQMDFYNKYHIDRKFTSAIRNGTHWILKEINKNI